MKLSEEDDVRILNKKIATCKSCIYKCREVDGNLIFLCQHPKGPYIITDYVATIRGHAIKSGVHPDCPLPREGEGKE